MSSRSVITSTLASNNQIVYNPPSQIRNVVVRNPRSRPSDPIRFVPQNMRPNPAISDSIPPPVSLRSVRRVNNNRNISSYSKSVNVSRNVSAASLDPSSITSISQDTKSFYSRSISAPRNVSGSSLALSFFASGNISSRSESINPPRNFFVSRLGSSAASDNKSSCYSIDTPKNFLATSPDPSYTSASYNRNNSPYSNPVDITRNISASSLASSFSSTSHNSNNVSLPQSSDDSLASTISSQSSAISSQFSATSPQSSATSLQSSAISLQCFASPSSIRNLTDFDFLKLLGTGGSARVYLVRDKRTNKLVALKVISKTGRNNAQLNDVIMEQQTHRFVAESGDKLLLPILGSWHDELNFFIMTEFLPGSDLAVETMKSQLVDTERVRFYAAELVAALDSLHKKNVIHRDVKLSNILLDVDGHIRLCDYGSAIVFDEPTGWREKIEPVPAFITFDVDGSCNSGAFLKPSREPLFVTNDICGTPSFMSPEQHRGRDYSFDADIWGLGVSIFRMVTGRLPFGDRAQHKEDIKKSILGDPLVFRMSDDISPVLRALLEGLLAKRSRDRLTIAEIKAHPYFQGIDWEQVANRELPSPSKPYISPIPKEPKDIPPALIGANFPPVDDPFPSFHFTSEELDRPSPPSPTLTGASIKPEPNSSIFQHAGRFFKSLLPTFEKKKIPPPASRPDSQALRPLLLPSILLSGRSASVSPPRPSVQQAERIRASRSARFSGIELVPPRSRRQFSVFAESGFRSPPLTPLSRTNSYVPRNASPLQKSYSLPSSPSLPKIIVSRPCSVERETAIALSTLVSTSSASSSSASSSSASSSSASSSSASLPSASLSSASASSSSRASTDSSTRGNTLDRFKSWAQRLSSVSEDTRGESGRKMQKRKKSRNDDGDEEGWNFKCKGDPEDPSTRQSIGYGRF